MSTAREVHKFGGRGLSSARGRADAVSCLRRARAAGAHPVAVVSAREGVTDALDRAAAAEHPRRAVASLIDAEIATLRLSAASVERVRAAEARAFAEDESNWRRAAILALGETCTALHLVEALAQEDAYFVASSTCLPTEGGAIDARPCCLREQPGVGDAMRAEVAPTGLPIVTGFAGRGEDGRPSVMTRGGSDLSATWIGAALGAARVRLWKSVPGLCEADPDLVPGAASLPRLGYEEAELLAGLGARVLAAGALRPARVAGVPVELQALGAPEVATRISARSVGAAMGPALVVRPGDVALVGSLGGEDWAAALRADGFILRREVSDERVHFVSHSDLEPHDILRRLHADLCSGTAKKAPENSERPGTA